MLNKLLLKNFKVHKKLKILFDPHITTIVGTNYRGKSSILRAIKWVIFNKPNKNSVINWDAKNQTAKVKLYVNNIPIIRVKNRTDKNYYKFNNQIFKSFGTELPEVIKQQLNINYINFQGQHDLPFWFGETSGEVSRQLNNIVNLNIIDKTLSNIESKKRKINESIEITEERKAAARELKKSLEYVKDIDIDLKKIEVLKEKKECIERDIDKLKNYLDSLSYNISIRDKYIKYASDIKKILNKFEKYEKLCDTINKLSIIINKINSVKQTVYKKLPSFSSLENLYKNISNNTILIEKYKIILSNIHNCIKNIKYLENELKTIEELFKKKIGSTCPICLRPFQEK